MWNASRTLRVLGLGLALGGGCLGFGAGCNTGGGVSQMAEPTKPRMDKERETDSPPVKASPDAAKK